LANYENRNSRAFVSWIECQVLIAEDALIGYDSFI